MILSRTSASCLILGALIAVPLSVSGVEAGDYVQIPDRDVAVDRIADHCAQFGPGFVDVGSGVCGRVSNHVRVYVGTRNAAMNSSLNPWPANGTSSAALRSDGMVPGAEVTHLRVRGSLDSFSPFH